MIKFTCMKKQCYYIASDEVISLKQYSKAVAVHLKVICNVERRQGFNIHALLVSMQLNHIYPIVDYFVKPALQTIRKYSL